MITRGWSNNVGCGHRRKKSQQIALVPVEEANQTHR
jgi:hypothetical protein